MKPSVLVLLATFCFLALGGAAAAADRLPGTWAAKDPVSGEQLELIITPEHLQFGADEPPIPYTTEAVGDVVSIFIGGPGNPPATFTFLDADKAEFAIPGGPVIALSRAPGAAGGVAGGAVAPAAAEPGQPEGQPGGMAQGNLMDEITAALVPYGVTTRFEPLNESLEQLLSAGWKLDQAGGGSGGFTLLLTNGRSHALCMLVPKNLGQADTALSDCRRLN